MSQSTSTILVPAAAILCSSVLLSGCSDSGPKMYQLSGNVTYGPTPLPVGHIRFVPQQGVRNKDTVTQSIVKNGRYEVMVSGGLHQVLIRDMAGEIKVEEVQNPKTMFIKEYRTEIDLPKVNEVKTGDTVERDFDVPRSHH